MIVDIQGILGFYDYPFITAVIAVVVLLFFITSLFNILSSIFKWVGGN